MFLIITILLMPLINIGFNYVICSHADPHKVDFEILNIKFYVIFYVFAIFIATLLKVLSLRIVDGIITVLIIAFLLLIYSTKNKNALRCMSIIFIIPVIEEYLYRLLIYSSLGGSNMVIVTLVVVSSVSFSFLHYMQGRREMLIKLLLSIILSVIFIFTEEIIIVIIIHALYNIFAGYMNNWRKKYDF